VEWGPEATPEGQFNLLLGYEFPLSAMIAGSPHAPPLQDDRPTNEYYALRSLRHLRGPSPEVPPLGYKLRKPGLPVSR